MRAGAKTDAPESDPEPDPSGDTESDTADDEPQDTTTDAPEEPIEAEGPDEDGMTISSNGMSAGPSLAFKQDTSQRSQERDSDTQIRAQPGDFNSAGFAPRNAFTFQSGDFIRYMKEDGIIYQGYVQSGQPVEHGFNYYNGQDDDLVVKLNFDDGKHVAPISDQQKDRIEVMQAKGQTAYGRNVETVSPDEILAVSPDDEYDWYRVKEAWDEEANEPVVNDDS